MKRIIAILLIVFCFTLSACSALSLEEADILSVPKASGAESEIVSLIAENFSPSFELVYPLSGSNKNAIIVSDADKSGNVTAVATFRYQDDPGSVAILFAKEQNNQFTYLGSSTIPTTAVDRVDFSDLDGDGKDEILVGYQGASSSLKSIAIYQIGDEISVMDVAACYSRLILGDFNDDGADEALCITNPSSQEPPVATLLGYHPSKGLSVISSCELNAETAQIENLLYGKISQDTYGAVIDELTGDGEYTTEALYYDKDQKLLVNPLFIFNDAENLTRSERILSKDTDGDGVIEIPFVEKAACPEEEDEADYCDIVVWKNPDFSTYSLTEKKTAVICPDGTYTFTLSQDKKDSVTAKYSPAERKLTICSLDYDKNETKLKNELLYIKAYARESYQEDKVIEAKLYELPSDVYTFLIMNASDEYAYSDTEIEKCFEILTNS